MLERFQKALRTLLCAPAPTCLSMKINTDKQEGLPRHAAYGDHADII
jgi:hypothetical protein